MKKSTCTINRLRHETSLFVDGLESSTEYMVKLSYPGVIPVQYDVFMEHDTPDKPTEYSVHKRRIQDTRILRFQTDRYTQVWAYDEEEKPTVQFYSLEVTGRSSVIQLSILSLTISQSPRPPISQRNDS